MKPLIIYVEDNNKSTITLNKKQFEDLIKDAYKQGHDDGYNQGYSAGKNWPSYPITYTNTNLPTINTTPEIYKYEITCGGSGDSNL